MVYLFDHFELREKDFCLYEKEERIALEPKALQVLLLLVSKAGHLVEKGYLLETVWNDSFVEENTLTRTILVLRRALGDNRRDRILIETVPTKGYRFVAEVDRSVKRVTWRRLRGRHNKRVGCKGRRPRRATSRQRTFASILSSSKVTPNLAAQRFRLSTLFLNPSQASDDGGSSPRRQL
jgi:DNA-binding winged helix-turn-helix (wHTH) protein